MARRINPTGLVGKVRGEVEKDGGVLVIKRIVVTYAGLEVAPENDDTVERVLAVHAQSCPVARSLEGAIAIETRLA